MTNDELIQLFGRGDLAGVYHMPQGGGEPLKQAARAHHWHIHEAHLGEQPDRQALLGKLGQDLGFPDWYGANLDAVADCLDDLSWAPAPGHLFLLHDCDHANAVHSDDFVALLQIAADASARWQEENVPLWIFVDMRADGIAFLPDLA